MTRRIWSMRSRLANVGVALAGVLCACVGSIGPRPEDVPVRVDPSAEGTPILQALFRADTAGYTLVSARRSIGKPTLVNGSESEVLVTALDEAGNPLASISVPNPRTTHVCEGEPRSELVLREGFLNIRFAHPDAIQKLEVRVRRGPNEAFHHVYLVD